MGKSVPLSWTAAAWVIVYTLAWWDSVAWVKVPPKLCCRVGHCSLGQSVPLGWTVVWDCSLGKSGPLIWSANGSNRRAGGGMLNPGYGVLPSSPAKRGSLT